MIQVRENKISTFASKNAFQVLFVTMHCLGEVHIAYSNKKFRIQI